MYPEDFTSQELDTLRTYVETHKSGAVLAGPVTEPSNEVKVVTLDQTMTCENLHVGALRQFSTTWTDSLTNRA